MEIQKPKHYHDKLNLIITLFILILQNNVLILKI